MLTSFGWQHGGLKKGCQNALMVALFGQLPQAPIWPTSKYFGARQIANDKKIILSTENMRLDQEAYIVFTYIVFEVGLDF